MTAPTRLAKLLTYVSTNLVEPEGVQPSIQLCKSRVFALTLQPLSLQAVYRAEFSVLDTCKMGGRWKLHPQ